jgi:hypothetical protein
VPTARFLVSLAVLPFPSVLRKDCYTEVSGLFKLLFSSDNWQLWLITCLSFEKVAKFTCEKALIPLLVPEDQKEKVLSLAFPGASASSVEVHFLEVLEKAIALLIPVKRRASPICNREEVIASINKISTFLQVVPREDERARLRPLLSDLQQKINKFINC